MTNSTKNQLTSSSKISAPLLLDTTEIVIQKKHRCSSCNKLLGVEQITLPTFDIKCVRCGHLNSIIKDYERQVIITDKNGKILYINEQVVSATGYASHEILGNTPAIWGGQMTNEFYKELWNKITVEKKAIAVRLTNKHKNGQLYPVILRISPILDIDGNVELFIGMETVTEEINKYSSS